MKWKVPGRVVGFVSAFGAGALISAIAFELVLDASEHADSAIPGVALAAGAVTCFMGSRFFAKPGQAGREKCPQPCLADGCRARRDPRFTRKAPPQPSDSPSHSPCTSWAARNEAGCQNSHLTPAATLLKLLLELPNWPS